MRRADIRSDIRSDKFTKWQLFHPINFAIPREAKELLSWGCARQQVLRYAQDDKSWESAGPAARRKASKTDRILSITEGQEIKGGGHFASAGIDFIPGRLFETILPLSALSQ
jgi:hypothetical protein